jgi:hypothetical protein
MPADSNLRIGIVVPTLGLNIPWLKRALLSIENQTHPAEIIVVTKKGDTKLQEWLMEHSYTFCEDKGQGTVAGAINDGVEFLYQNKVEIFGFLGDDDILLPTAVASLYNALQKRKKGKCVAAFGSCWYVDETGKTIFANKSNLKLVAFMHIFPNVLPHPGALMYTRDWANLGGFDASLRFAPDLDYWFRLSKMGHFVRISTPVSLFGWNSVGLTGSLRRSSILEAQMVRKRYAKGIKGISYTLLAPLMIRIGEFVMQSQMKRS